MSFELGLNGPGLGLMIFLKISPRTHHNYTVFVTKSLCHEGQENKHLQQSNFETNGN